VPLAGHRHFAGYHMKRAKAAALRSPSSQRAIRTAIAKTPSGPPASSALPRPVLAGPFLVKKQREAEKRCRAWTRAVCSSVPSAKGRRPSQRLLAMRANYLDPTAIDES